MKKALLVLGLVLVASAMVFAGGAQESKEPAAEKETMEEGFSGPLAMGGSTTVAPIIFSAIEAFEDVQPNVEATYESVGSSNGIAGALDGVYQIGGSSKSEKKNKDAGVIPTRICFDGIAVIVHNDVLIDDISVEDVTKIYSGEYTNWSQLGGQDAEIVITSRDEASGTYDTWKGFTVKAAGVKFREGMVTVVSNGDLVTKINSTPNSIGYIGAGFKDLLKDSKVITVNGIEASEDNVVSFEYPFSRYLYLVSKEAPVAGSLEDYFINWLLTSREGKKSISDNGYFPLR